MATNYKIGSKIYGWTIVSTRMLDPETRLIFLLSPDRFYELTATEVLGPRKPPEYLGYLRTATETTDGYSFIDVVPGASLGWSKNIHVALEKANKLVFSNNKLILTSKTWIGDGQLSSKKIREGIRGQFKNGTKEERRAIALLVAHFIKDINQRIFKGTIEEERDGLEALRGFTEENPQFRKFLPDKLSVIADELESKGLVKTNPLRKTSIPEWRNLINKCRKLWDAYYYKPTKSNLKTVIKHLDKMKNSNSKKVQDEMKRCLRAVNKELKT